MIAEKLEWEGDVNWNTKPPRAGEIYLLNSSNAKLTAHTGWEPKTELSEGVDRTIAIWQEILASRVPNIA